MGSVLSALLGFLRTATSSLPGILQGAARTLTQAARTATPQGTKTPSVSLVVLKPQPQPRTVTVLKPHSRKGDSQQTEDSPRQTKRKGRRRETSPPQPEMTSAPAPVLTTASEHENARELARTLAELRSGQTLAESPRRPQQPSAPEPLPPPPQQTQTQESVPFPQPSPAERSAPPPPLPPREPPPLPQQQGPLTPPPLPHQPSQAPASPQPSPASSRPLAAPSAGLQPQRAAPRGEVQPSQSLAEAEKKTQEAQRAVDQNTDALEDNTEQLRQQEKASRELLQVGGRFSRALMQLLITPPALSNLSRMFEGVAQAVIGRYAEVAKFAPQAQWSILRLQHEQMLLSAQSVRALSGNISQLTRALIDTQRAWAPFRNVMAATMMGSLSVALRMMEYTGKSISNILVAINALLKFVSQNRVNIDHLLSGGDSRISSLAADFFGRLTRSDWHGLVPPPQPEPRFDRPFGPLRPPRRPRQ